MAATAEKTRKLRVEETEALKDPQIVINSVEVTIALGAPFMFGVPLRLVNGALERLGLVTKEELAGVIQPTVPPAEEFEFAPVAKPAVKAAPRRSARPRAA